MWANMGLFVSGCQGRNLVQFHIQLDAMNADWNKLIWQIETEAVDSESLQASVEPKTEQYCGVIVN